MQIGNDQHLTYCTNIHPGEKWHDTFAALQKYIPSIKKNICPDKKFGIGLRLSNLAALDLHEKANIHQLTQWMQQTNTYVFTINGFPYGGFHGAVVKDKVHSPDWLSHDRVLYTNILANILAQISDTPEAGISTSPISYKYWYPSNTLYEIKINAAQKLIEVALHLHNIYESTGKTIHLDIEPEPDGVLRNGAEFLDFYTNILLPQAKAHLKRPDYDDIIITHIRLCYDVCHIAVEYENHAQIIDAILRQGIYIGKIQISAALKIILSNNISDRQKQVEILMPFQESTYLHQVVQRNHDGLMVYYPDMPNAMEQINNINAAEWRIHYHVPIFASAYGKLRSTQSDILEVLNINKKNLITNHLEVETYTWDVLPKDTTMSVEECITNEMKWVINNM
ncbi:MAG: metabolite traffic protein EboE [Cytophagales bacterium]|nr:metabolite traffic protein EboE [Cytophagales bacterium]